MYLANVDASKLTKTGLYVSIVPPRLSVNKLSSLSHFPLTSLLLFFLFHFVPTIILFHQIQLLQ
jgi:hypothetical protein